MVFSAVRETLGDSILLSGGLDTSVVATVASTFPRGGEGGLKAYTVVLKGAPSPDLGYSKLIAGMLGLRHEILGVSVDEVEGALPDVIGVLKSFDPMEVRNSVATFIGLRRAQADGFRAVMTGDAADELFAGYSFIFRLPEAQAKEALVHLWRVMRFSSVPLAESLRVAARLPFLQGGLKEFAMHRIKYPYLVGRRDGTGELFGKYVLRVAFDGMLPEAITWRTKTPIEQGSGTTALQGWYAQRVKDAEFGAKRKGYIERDGVRIRDKEQLAYYEIYRRIHGPPRPLDLSRRACPACGSNVPDAATFCTTCGEYPI
jgi:asparagine synthase (glutamine-hydrolysing)